jgi:uncharacterized membrane protein YfcA
LEKAVAILVGAAVGAPVGVTFLTWANPQHAKIGVGAFLVLYSLYALFRPAMEPIKGGGAAADAGIGFFNGMIGGMTGLAGILVTIWCGLRGWPKDVQRTVFQPVAVAVFVMSALWLGAKGAVTAETIKLFVIGLPALFAGLWAGMKLYGLLNERSKLSEGRSHPAARLRGYTGLLRNAGLDLRRRGCWGDAVTAALCQSERRPALPDLCAVHAGRVLGGPC